jgi:hypothetical protein
VIKAHDQAITHHLRSNAVCATMGNQRSARSLAEVGQRPPQSRAAPDESRGGPINYSDADFADLAVTPC